MNTFAVRRRGWIGSVGVSRARGSIEAVPIRPELAIALDTQAERTANGPAFRVLVADEPIAKLHERGTRLASSSDTG